MPTNAARRTFQKVRRNSRLVGTIEKDLWRPTDRRTMRRALKAAERYERHHKPKGRRNGPLGHVGLEVYRALWGRVRFSDGCLCPSLEWLQTATRRSRAAVVGALKRLKLCGFLTWARRLDYTGGPRGVRGPQVHQATNAYALQLPKAAERLLPDERPPWPIPADDAGRRQERDQALAAYEREAFENSPLGAAVTRLGASIRNASLPSARNPSSGDS